MNGPERTLEIVSSTPQSGGGSVSIGVAQRHQTSRAHRLATILVCILTAALHENLITAVTDVRTDALSHLKTCNRGDRMALYD